MRCKMTRVKRVVPDFLRSRPFSSPFSQLNLYFLTKEQYYPHSSFIATSYPDGNNSGKGAMSTIQLLLRWEVYCKPDKSNTSHNSM